LLGTHVSHTRLYFLYLFFLTQNKINMFNLLQAAYSYYYVVLILQGICVIHSIRKGNQSKWIWIIVFLPLIGSIAYIFTDIIKKRHISSLQSGVVSVVNPNGRIRDLEKRFEFTDTFENRVALADAYLENGMNEKAIELYEPALNGLFKNNEHLVKQLVLAYTNVNRYEDIVKICPRITGTINFSKSLTNLQYAVALDKMGFAEAAEKEFISMNRRLINYEQRFFYGEFLVRQEREEDAVLVFQEMLEESKHFNRTERGKSKIWIDRASVEWTRLMSS
jgi:hypothetical protein